MKIISFVAALLLASASNILDAEESPPVSDPKIISIVSGGYWQTDEMSGTYRIVLWTEGFEHVSTGVVAEWVADPGSHNDEQKVVHSEILVSPGVSFYQTPTIKKTKSGYSVILKGVNTYDSKLKISCVFKLSQDMKTNAVASCS
jgi:hypothetical protein